MLAQIAWKIKRKTLGNQRADGANETCCHGSTIADQVPIIVHELQLTLSAWKLDRDKLLELGVLATMLRHNKCERRRNKDARTDCGYPDQEPCLC